MSTTPSQIKAPFGARLKAVRSAAGLTQQQLGMEVGLDADVAATRINRYERGVHDADTETATKLASRLGVPLAYLYSDSDLLAEAILAFSRLPPENQQTALKLIVELASSTK